MMGDGTTATLPPLARPLGQMTKKDVMTFIPQMMKSVTGRVRPAYGKKNQQPSWWPKEVPWMNPKLDSRTGKQKLEWLDALRGVIYNCYAYHGQESMLAGQLHQGSMATSGDEPPAVAKRPSRSVTFSTSENKKAEGKLSLECPTLGSSSQDMCPSPLTAASVPTAGLPQANSPTEQGKTGSAEKQYLEVYQCYFCQSEHSSRVSLQKHQQDCSARTPTKTTRQQLLQAKSRRAQTALHLDVSPSKEKAEFMEGFQLLPRSKALSLQQRKKRDLDCQIIDLQHDPVPKTPTTPRSKSLISQLSRDMSPTSAHRHLFSDERRLSTGRSSTENCEVESEKSDDEEEVKLGRTASLLTIALSSLLGQRIKKHVRGDKNNNEKDSDDEDKDENQLPYESYCHTPKKGQSEGRLRSRPNPFPVTYKKKRGTGPHVHKYKFNKIDRAEFKVLLATGLDKKSRELKSRMKPCRVELKNLTRREIAHLVAAQGSVTGKIRGPTRPHHPTVSAGQTLNMLLAAPALNLHAASTWQPDHTSSPQRVLLFKSQEGSGEMPLYITPTGLYPNFAVSPSSFQGNRTALAASSSSISLPLQPQNPFTKLSDQSKSLSKNKEQKNVKSNNKAVKRLLQDKGPSQNKVPAKKPSLEATAAKKPAQDKGSAQGKNTNKKSTLEKVVKKSKQDKMVAKKPLSDKIAVKKPAQDKAASKKQVSVKITSKKYSGDKTVKKPSKNKIQAKKLTSNRAADKKVKEAKVAVKKSEENKVASRKSEESKVGSKKSEETKVANKKSVKNKTTVMKPEHDKVAAKKPSQSKMTSKKSIQDKAIAKKSLKKSSVEKLAAENSQDKTVLKKATSQKLAATKSLKDKLAVKKTLQENMNKKQSDKVALKKSAHKNLTTKKAATASEDAVVKPVPRTNGSFKKKPEVKDVDSRPKSPLASNDLVKESQRSSPMPGLGKEVEALKAASRSRRDSVESSSSIVSRGSRTRKPDCDVISISSSEEDDEGSLSRNKGDGEDSTNNKGSKRPAPSKDRGNSQAVLFKCHLCYAEIMFNLATTDFIKRHFAEKHNVPNIQILEHRDQNNQLVLSIVEDSPADDISDTSSTSQAPRRSSRKRGDEDVEASGDSNKAEVICID